MGDYAALPPSRRNLVWPLFTEPAWRRMLLDWDVDAARVLAQFRATMGHHVGEPAWSKLVDELLQHSRGFRDLWQRHGVAGAAPRVKRYLHPEAGLLRLESTHLSLVEQPDHRLLVYTPADENAHKRLRELVARPPYAPWRSHEPQADEHATAAPLER